MSVLGVIPARYGSTRFPGKPLADIGGKSLVRRVWERAVLVAGLDAVIVATDDERILQHVEGFGGRAVLTSPDHASGTDRVGEVARLMPHGYYVNMQGDEPLLNPQAVAALVAATTGQGAEMGTLVSLVAEAEAAEVAANPNVVKVVCDGQGYALYFSRAPVPYQRNPGVARLLKHVGIYMYSREALLRICAAPPVMLEQAEGLEQLRALYLGIRILAVETGYNPAAVDVPGDVDVVLAQLAAQG
jgi:3-deoxy-manno-octulosonate cytidylyltransferase (CMP-KDO synthetase)